MTDHKKETPDRFYRMLGLARRAGKLTIGTPLTLQGLHKGSVRLLIVSSLASSATQKKMETQSAYYRIPLLTVEIPPEELARLLGKQAPVVSVGVTDDRFAAELTKSSGKEDSESDIDSVLSEHGV